MAAQERLGRRGTLVGGLWMVSANLVPLVGTLALSVTMGRILGPDLLGQQSFIAYIQALLSSLLVFTLTTASIQVLASDWGARDQERYDHDARWSYWGHALGGAVSALTLSVIGISRGDPWPWAVVALATLFDSFGWAYGARTIGRSGWKAVAARRLLWQLVGQVLAIGAVLVGWGITGVFAASATASAALLIVLFRQSPRVKRVPLRPFPRVLLRITGSFLVLAVLTQVVNRRVEFLFLEAFSTSQQLAMYSIAFMLVSTAAGIPISLAAAGMPTIAAAQGADEGHRVVAQFGVAVRVTLTASLPLASGVAALGPTLISLLYGQEYTEAASLVPLLSVSILFVPIASVCAGYWAGIGRMRREIVASSVAGVLDLGAAWLLVPGLGAWGAAVANVVGQVTAAVLILALTWVALGRFTIGIGRRLWGLSVVGLSGLAAWAVAEWAGGWVGLVLGAVLFTLVLAVLSRVAGLLSSTDGAWLNETLPERLAWVGRLLSARS